MRLLQRETAKDFDGNHFRRRAIWGRRSSLGAHSSAHLWESVIGDICGRWDLDPSGVRVLYIAPDDRRTTCPIDNSTDFVRMCNIFHSFNKNMVDLLVDTGEVTVDDDCGSSFPTYKERRWDAKELIGSGGMPSSHSATVTALAIAIGFKDGFGSSLFATAMILASVVMYDASGVRLHAGRQAEVLNQIAYELPEEHPLADTSCESFLATPLHRWLPVQSWDSS